MKSITLGILFVTVFWANIANARFPYPERTPSVRLTGVLLPIDEQDREDLITLKVFVQGQPWLFRVGKVEKLAGSERAQAIRQELLRRQVRLYGPEDLIAPLQEPEIAGKPLTIEGRFYANERRLLVTAVEKVPGTTPYNQ